MAGREEGKGLKAIFRKNLTAGFLGSGARHCFRSSRSSSEELLGESEESDGGEEGERTGVGGVGRVRRIGGVVVGPSSSHHIFDR